MNDHRRIEERSLLLHRAVAEKLARDPAVLANARQRVERWLVDGSVHRRYAEAWLRLLSLGPEDISQQLVDPGESALAPRERWQILRRYREAQGS